MGCRLRMYTGCFLRLQACFDRQLITASLCKCSALLLRALSDTCSQDAGLILDKQPSHSCKVSSCAQQVTSSQRRDGGALEAVDGGRHPHALRLCLGDEVLVLQPCRVCSRLLGPAENPGEDSCVSCAATSAQQRLSEHCCNNVCDLRLCLGYKVQQPCRLLGSMLCPASIDSMFSLV